MERIILLCRVSGMNGQSYERQVVELTEYCAKCNWQIVKIFANKISGAKKNEERPEIMEMLDFIKTNPIDKVVCLEISRLGRNTLEALKVIDMLTERGIALHIKNYNLTTLNPDKSVNIMCKLMCTIALEISSLERSLIVERVASGRNQYIANCRKNGVKMGRPATYRKPDDAMKNQYAKEISLLRKGISLRNISAITGTSIGTIRKLKKYV